MAEIYRLSRDGLHPIAFRILDRSSKELKELNDLKVLRVAKCTTLQLTRTFIYLKSNLVGNKGG